LPYDHDHDGPLHRRLVYKGILYQVIVVIVVIEVIVVSVYCGSLLVTFDRDQGRQVKNGQSIDTGKTGHKIQSEDKQSEQLQRRKGRSIRWNFRQIKFTT